MTRSYRLPTLLGNDEYSSPALPGFALPHWALRSGILHAATAVIAAAALIGCDNGAESNYSEAAGRGRSVYMNVCIACHNGDPSKDGALGPAIAGSSLELIEAKVLRAEYPEGYEPKRAGIVMPKFAYIEENLPDIAAFLAEVKK